MKPRLIVYLGTFFAIAYALVAHIAVSRASSALTVSAVALLAGTVLAPPLVHGRIWAWLSVPVIGLGCWWLNALDTPILLLYLPPMLGTLFMAWLFGHTLSAGRTPLIAQIIRLMHPAGEEPDAAVWRYARRLTALWTALFIALTLLDLFLALIVKPDGLLSLAGVDAPIAVSQELWSLFANLLQYAVVALFFVGEYVYRLRHFPQQPYRNIFDFVRRAIAASPRLFGGGK